MHHAAVAVAAEAIAQAAVAFAAVAAAVAAAPLETEFCAAGWADTAHVAVAALVVRLLGCYRS